MVTQHSQNKPLSYKEEKQTHQLVKKWNGTRLMTKGQRLVLQTLTMKESMNVTPSTKAEEQISQVNRDTIITLGRHDSWSLSNLWSGVISFLYEAACGCFSIREILLEKQCFWTTPSKLCRKNFREMRSWLSSTQEIIAHPKFPVGKIFSCHNLE
ncbi:hypothetical protein RRG08_029248 [Elysia crispata]|uniref:Uncharacterized protein n=1 Tax=Elysia crispata TaxID=231223 RepID=A0AAE1AKJ2_9GAST|nr:hypothetical protein RRG08_029248 [Elysia crispata]